MTSRPARVPLIAIVAVFGVLSTLAGCGRVGMERRDEHGMTALMRAARDGDSVEAARLVSRGANVNATVPTRDFREFIAFISWMQELPSSDIGFRPLHYAAGGGHLEIARMLLDNGADAHHAARGGTTALDLAVSRSDLPMMALLIDAGVRPQRGQLAAAVSRGTPEAVRFLLERGADPNARTAPTPSTATFPPLLIMAVQRGDPEVLELLLDAGADPNVRDENGWSPLRWARLGATRGGRPPRGRTEGVAARNSPAQIIALLEAAGATDEEGARADALIDAVRRKDPAAVRAALAAGANPNATDQRGVPPLVHAASAGEADIVQALITAGARVNVTPDYDDTPLIAAIIGGHVDVVRALLAAGADASRADRLDRTPLQVASSWRRTEMTTMLLEASAAPDPGALANAALVGNPEAVRLLLDRGVDPNANGGHALSEAARGCHRRDNEDIIRMLLDAGATLGTAGGQAALRRAAGMCEPTVVALLLERGADPSAGDLNNFTPLTHAASSGRLDVVRLLIAAGADVNARDADGKTLLQYAEPYPEIQAELRRAGAR